MANYQEIYSKLSEKSSEELIEILKLNRENYQPEAVEIIEEILLSKNFQTDELKQWEADYKELKAQRIFSGKNVKSPADVFSRGANYIIDQIVILLVFFITKNLAKTDTYGAHAIILSFLYYSILTSQYGKTLGMAILGLSVVSRNSDKKITFGNACFRWFGMLVSGLILGIGYLMFFFNKNKQTLYDYISNSLVVKDK